MEPVGRVCEERQVSGGGPGCVKTRAFNCSQKVLLNLVNLKTKSTGDGYPRKAIKKAVLRFLGSRTFSHGLDRLRSILYRAEIGGSGWIPVLRRIGLGEKVAPEVLVWPATALGSGRTE